MLQVKSTSRRGPILLGTRLDRVVGDWVVLCRSVLTESFLLTPGEPRGAAVEVEKDGLSSYRLLPRSHDRPEFREAWPRLGVGAAAPGAPSAGGRTRTARR